MTDAIKQYPRGQPYVFENGRLTERALQQNILLVELDVLAGTGSPEGNVIAKQKRLYMDLNGSAGNILYIKRNTDIGGDRSQGWILV